MTFLPYAFEDLFKEYSLFAVYFFGLIFISAIILIIRDSFFPDISLNKKNLSKYIDMNEALNDAWNKLEGSSFINGLQCLDLGERYGDKRMYWLWREFIDKNNFNIDLYGEREPSSNIRLIDKSIIQTDGSDTYDIKENAIKIKNSSHKFKNLKILKSDLKRFINEYA